jgi:excisionase family DNA binding protein
MADIAGTLSLNDAAEELGVHYMTVYRYVRLGRLPAVKHGTQWHIRRSDLDAFRDGEEATPGEPAPWDDRLRVRLLAADQAGAWAVVEAALAAGHTPTGIYTDVLGPALREIGAMWERGEIGEGDEHVATALATRLIGRLGPRFAKRGQARATVIAAAPPGERHVLGLEMMADILRGAGYEVISLGADVPLRSLVLAVERADRLRAVCLSVVVEQTVESAARAIEAVREVSNVPILVGGPALDAELAARIGADAYAPDGPSSVEAIDAIGARTSA